MKKFVLVGLLALTVALCGCSTSQVVASLDIATAAIEAAEPFAGPYATWLGLAAAATSASATEVASTDPASTQAEKIITSVNGVLQTIPVVQNASATTQAKIQAVVSALKAIVALLQPNVPATAMMSHAVVKAVGAPMPLKRGDAVKLKQLIERAHAVQVKLTAGAANRS